MGKFSIGAEGGFWKILYAKDYFSREIPRKKFSRDNLQRGWNRPGVIYRQKRKKQFFLYQK